MKKNNSIVRQYPVVIIIASFIIIKAGVIYAQSMITQILMALFISIICAQPIAWLQKKKIPQGLAITIVLIGTIVVFLGFGQLIGSSLSSFSENVPKYEENLKEKGISFIRSNRGGDITYHGPGQIVGYPIINLDNFFPDIHLYMRKLEEVIIQTIADYGLKGERSKGETGVWLDVGTPFARKICALGVRTSRWVTMHGFALNVSTDLGYFDHIIPCGIRGKNITSLEVELQKNIPQVEVKTKILKHFSKIFEVEFVK